MGDQIISSSPESTDENALKIPVLNYVHPNLGSIKVPYGAFVDLHSYAIVLTNSAAAASKNHLTLFNTSTRKIRIRKIEASANITGTITGQTCMLTVQGLTTPAPTGGTDFRSPERVRPMSTALADPTTGDPLSSLIQVRAAPNANINVVSDYHLVMPKPLHVEEAVTTTGDYVVLYEKDGEFSTIHLDTNQGITIQQGTFAGAGSINLGVYFTMD